MAKFKLFKDRKGKADQAKNNKFVKLGREIYVQARKGGPNPDANFGLKTAIHNARQINMPVDNIERAIKKASGNGENVEYDEIYYEGYGPGGVAIMVKCLTDNRNRTAADVRSIFNKRGGNMGESGCVAYMFDQKGILIIDREKFADLDEDILMMQSIESGADDIVTNEDSFEVLTHPHEFESVKSAMEAAKFEFSSSEVSWIPQNMVGVEGENAEKLLKMMDAFEDNDDVQDVYTNFEISDEEMARLG
ncbi:YebC/PmpR family DNA-binding regulatory protein [Paenibacillus sp. DS2015]|uniref:YebC/PmpR family DNA-binding transcriptional regulator n=1 Tax=Paenibacillus sp. DS2015 TaxID=3373917 RepID=UPI003D193E7C